MSQFFKFFFRRPPDGLLEISENIFVFDHSFSTEIFDEVQFDGHVGTVVRQLKERYPGCASMVFNFEAGKRESRAERVLSGHGLIVMGYPRHYEGCPLLSMEMIHHFLRSSGSWLSLGPGHLLLLHAETGGWPVLAFMLAALLVYLRRYSDERQALEMVYRVAPEDILDLFVPLDPFPSQLRYLQYVSRWLLVPDLWPSEVEPTRVLDFVFLRKIPNFDGHGGCRPIYRVYGPDPREPGDARTKLLYSTPKAREHVRHYTQDDVEIAKTEIRCGVTGDVVLECISLEEDLLREVMVFRVMFNTAFIGSGILVLGREQIDTLWDTKERFPENFRVEMIFSEAGAAAAPAPAELIVEPAPSSDESPAGELKLLPEEETKEEAVAVYMPASVSEEQAEEIIKEIEPDVSSAPQVFVEKIIEEKPEAGDATAAGDPLKSPYIEQAADGISAADKGPPPEQSAEEREFVDAAVPEKKEDEHSDRLISAEMQTAPVLELQEGETAPADRSSIDDSAKPKFDDDDGGGAHSTEQSVDLLSFTPSSDHESSGSVDQLG